MAFNHKQRKECYNNASTVLGINKLIRSCLPLIGINLLGVMTTEGFSKVSKAISYEIDGAYHLEFGLPLLPAADCRGWKLN